MNPLRGDDQRVQSRFHYRPGVIKILFVGESAPHNGTFFYHKDSNLFNGMLEAFKEVYPEINQVNFLEKFKEMGFYLEDLCEEPVNHLSDRVRVTLRKLYEPTLQKKIALFEPEIIIYTPKTYLKTNIETIMNNLNLSVPMYGLSFPGRPEHTRFFIDDLAKILTDLKQEWDR